VRCGNTPSKLCVRGNRAAVEPFVGGLVLGTEAFAQALLRQAGGNRHEQTELRRWRRGLVGADYHGHRASRGQKWKEFCHRYGIGGATRRCGWDVSTGA